MTETTSAATEEFAGAPDIEDAEAEAAAGETTEEGRYIPYGGGSMGWYENSGVLNCELGNNYLFYTAMASDLVRSKQFQRWGERFNRRGDRKRVKRMTGLTVGEGRNAVRGTTRDLSRHGIRVQFLDEVTLQKGDKVKIKLHESEESDAVQLECDARVVWAQRIGKIRPVWSIGMTLENLSSEQEQKLAPLLQT